VPFALVTDRPVDDRLRSPEDRYAPAGGCYTLEAPGQGFVSRDARGALRVERDPAAAEPFHFQATRLGEYLIATNEGRDTRYEGADWDVRGYLAADGSLTTNGGVGVATEPSPDADWRLVAAGTDPERKVTGGRKKTQGYVLSLPAREETLVVTGGALRLTDEPGVGTPLTLRHVADDDRSDADANGTACATWPEIDTDAQGRPAPTGADPSAPVQGFFEAHVHGMAFEFLGGELRCGRPWHEYGVEFALGSCTTRRTRSTARSRCRWAATRRSTPRRTTRRAGRPSAAGRSTARSPTSSTTGAGSSAPTSAACA
jgi:hypothetical protein